MDRRLAVHGETAIHSLTPFPQWGARLVVVTSSALKDIRVVAAGGFVGLCSQVTATTFYPCNRMLD
jgi:hypothetical protein